MQRIMRMFSNICSQQGSSINLLETKKILQKDLFQISPLNKSVSREILSLAYSPGVGEVCLEILNNPKRVDTLTFRGRAVAVVSDGSMLDSEGRKFMPAMDWFVAQLKYYAGVDAFPFVIRKETNLEDLFKDLSTTYGTILYLDDHTIPAIPENLLVVKQQQIAQHFGLELTDASKTAVILAYLIQNKIKGVAKVQQYNAGKDYQSDNFIESKEFQKLLHDNRTLRDHALEFHQFYKGKIGIELKFRDISKLQPYFTQQALKRLVQQDEVYSKTGNICAIVTDGTAILGFGSIGPVAGLPVMEGKAMIFKMLGDVDVVPFCMYPRKTMEEQIIAIYNSTGYFRAINLQDIKAPQCFEVERGLKKLKTLPVFHDDQHGTAIVVLAGLITSIKLAQKKIQDVKIIVNGAGAAGDTIARLILKYGAQGKNMIVCDSKGSIYAGRKEGMNEQKDELAKVSNLQLKVGSLQDVIQGADVFIGVSVGGALKKEWVKKMGKNPIIFALANPNPQILPEEAAQGGAFIYASGRSDYDNQINNSLVFPGIFKSILRHGLKQITDEMKLTTAKAVSNSLTKEASTKYIIPDSLDRDVTLIITEALRPIKW